MLFNGSQPTAQKLTIQSMLMTGIIIWIVTPENKTRSNPLANKKSQVHQKNYGWFLVFFSVTKRKFCCSILTSIKAVNKNEYG